MLFDHFIMVASAGERDATCEYLRNFGNTGNIVGANIVLATTTQILHGL